MATSTGAAAWPQHRADGQNTAAVASPEPGNGNLQWDHKFDLRTEGSPAVSDAAVLVMAEEVHALELDTGKHRWSFLPVWGNFTSPPGWLEAGPVSDGERVFVSTAYPSIHALDLQTGEEIWRWNTANMPRSLAIGAERGYAGLDENVSAFGIGDGQEDWRYRAEARLGGITLAEGVVYASTTRPASQGHSVFALDAATGERIWSHETGAPMAGPPAVGAEHVFVGSVGDEAGPPPAVWALDRDDGDVGWRTDTDADVRQPVAVSEGTVIAATGGEGDEDGAILALDAGTGERVWTQDGRGPVAVAGSIVYGAGGPLRGLSLADGDTARVFTNSSGAEDVALADGALLAVGDERLRVLDAGRALGDRDVPLGTPAALLVPALVALLARAVRHRT